VLCDCDPKWSGGVEQWLATAGVRVVRTPPRAPNCNAFAERFVRSVKEECLNRVVPLGERHLRRTLYAFAAHYHHERNHQGLANELIERADVQRACGAVRRRQRVGGILIPVSRVGTALSSVGQNGVEFWRRYLPGPSAQQRRIPPMV
jgi:putative transposase